MHERRKLCVCGRLVKVFNFGTFIPLKRFFSNLRAGKNRKLCKPTAHYAKLNLKIFNRFNYQRLFKSVAKILDGRQKIDFLNYDCSNCDEHTKNLNYGS